MERLTINYPDGAVQTIGKIDEIVLRLAAYEDTGLEPEEVAYFLGTEMSVKDAKAQYAEHKKRYDEYMAWKQAEAEGRLVVLPCKVGDTVYRIQFGFDFEQGATEIGVYDVPFATIYLPEVGKTVFLTREEAEAVRKEGAEC